MDTAIKIFHKKIFIIVFLGLIFPSYSSVFAQTITQNIPLSFGKIVITDNNGTYKIKMRPDGGYNADPQFIFFLILKPRMLLLKDMPLLQP